MKDSIKEIKETEKKVKDKAMINRKEVINLIDRIKNSGMGKNKALDYIRKVVEFVL